MSKMSSPSVVQKDAEEAALLDQENHQEIVNEIEEFLKFRKQEDKENKEDKEEKEEKTKKNGTKRKRKDEDTIPINILKEVFLRIYYPISLCLGKSVTAGLMKSSQYTPTVILQHGTKMVIFSETAWESFLKHLNLIECYLNTNVCGRKTNIRLLDSDNEIDIVKNRGTLQVRFRDLTQHESKILLSREEFYILMHATSPISRYMKQLVFSSSIIKEYLIDTLEKQPESTILYGHVDTSIFNRLPHEVGMWRQLRNFESIDEEAIEAVEEYETINQEEPATQEV